MYIHTEEGNIQKCKNAEIKNIFAEKRKMNYVETEENAEFKVWHLINKKQIHYSNSLYIIYFIPGGEYLLSQEKLNTPKRSYLGLPPIIIPFRCENNYFSTSLQRRKYVTALFCSRFKIGFLIQLAWSCRGSNIRISSLNSKWLLVLHLRRQPTCSSEILKQKIRFSIAISLEYSTKYSEYSTVSLLLKFINTIQHISSTQGPPVLLFQSGIIKIGCFYIICICNNKVNVFFQGTLPFF